MFARYANTTVRRLTGATIAKVLKEQVVEEAIVRLTRSSEFELNYALVRVSRLATNLLAFRTAAG